MFIRPNTKVERRLPKIWEDIIKAQNKPNNSLFLSALATLLVYDPCATQIIEADSPVMLAPRLTHIQTTAIGIYISVTIRRPVA